MTGVFPSRIITRRATNAEMSIKVYQYSRVSGRFETQDNLENTVQGSDKTNENQEMNRELEQLYEASIKYLEPQILKEWLLTKQKHDNLHIIDVRDSDYKYGHITSSVNFPSKSFTNETISSLIEQFPVSPDQIYVFHCMRSQTRGPACCKRFIRYLCLKVVNSPEDLNKLPKVYILKGGLKRWNMLYGRDSRLMKPIE